MHQECMAEDIVVHVFYIEEEWEGRDLPGQTTPVGDLPAKATEELPILHIQLMDKDTEAYFKSKAVEWVARYTNRATKYTETKVVADSTPDELQHLKAKRKSGREFYNW